MNQLKNSKIQAHLALFCVALIYGLNYTLAKDVMPYYIGPRGLILLRALGSSPPFLAYCVFFKWERPVLKDHLRFFICAIFGVALNQLSFFEGLSITTPINAAVMMTVNPILVLLMAAIILKEPLRVARILGIGLGIIGALVLITRGGSQVAIFSAEKSLGNLLVFVNAASYAAYLVLVKPLMLRYKPITVIRWVFTYGLLIVLPFGTGQLTQVNWPALPVDAIWRMVFVVVGTTYLAYLLNVFALKTVSSTTASFYIYLQPVTAALAAIALGKDELTWILLMAASLIFTGVYFVSFYKPRITNAKTTG